MRPRYALLLVLIALGAGFPQTGSAPLPQELEQRAQEQEAAEALTAALQTRHQVFLLRQQRHGTGDWRVTDARLACERLDLLLHLSNEARRRIRHADGEASQVERLLQQGKTVEALPRVQQVDAERQKLLGPRHLARAASLDLLGLVYRRLGDFPQALRHFEQARAIRQELLGEKHPDYAISLDHLAALHQMLNDLPRAHSLAEQAWGLRRRHLPEDHPACVASLQTLAILHQTAGDHATAFTLVSQVHELRRRTLAAHHPDCLRSLHQLAMLAHALRDYPQALQGYEQVRSLLEQHYSATHPLYASCLNNLAELHKQLGQSALALNLLREARVVWQKTLPPRHPSYAVNLHNLARSCRDLSEYAEAAALAEEALSIQQGVLEHTLAALSERQRLEFLGNRQRTLQVFLSVAPAAGWSAEQTYEVVFAGKGILATRQAEERLQRDEPGQQVLLSRLQQVRAELARLVHTPPGRTADWSRLLEKLEAEKEKLEIDLARSNPAFRQLQEVRRGTVAKLRQALPAGTAFVDLLDYQHTLSAPEGKKTAGPESRTLAFVVTRDRPVVQVQLGPTQPIEVAVRTWRQNAGKAGGPELGADLAQLVWRPLRDHLPAIQTLVLAPDGPLHALPWAALPGSRPGSYLLEEMNVTYVTSGRHLLEVLNAPTVSSASGFLAVGGLDFGSIALPSVDKTDPRPRWPPLPGTRLEVESVAQLFRTAYPQTRSLLLDSPDTNAEKLRSHLQDPVSGAGWRFLHVATHAFHTPAVPETYARSGGRTAYQPSSKDQVTGRNPLLSSGLVLAGANRQAAGTILTAEEVASLDLRGTALVVLSACDTGLGVVAVGEGVLGLQRAFQTAGARTLVASLWNVQDAPTSVLMEEFYGNLWRKQLPPAEALRQAQLTLLRNPERVRQRVRDLLASHRQRGVADALLMERGILPQAGDAVQTPLDDAKSSPPAWWAAFVLSGDWR